MLLVGLRLDGIVLLVIPLLPVSELIIEMMVRLCLQPQLPHTETMETQLLEMDVMHHELLKQNGNVQEVIQLQLVLEMMFEVMAMW